jgi:FkbM family methyltransferase
MDQEGEFAPQELMQLAGKLAWLRPLTPYPGWRFASAWDNPRPAFKLRAETLNAITALPGPAKLEFAWHHGSRVNLDLRDDGGKAVYIGGCIEPNEMAALDKILRPGMTFVDVGANMGLFTLLASGCVGADGLVWAFEPSARELKKLSANIVLSGAKNVRTHAAALLDRAGAATLSVASEEHSGQNTLGSGFVYDISLEARESVETARLDDLAEDIGRPIDVLKVDVEGAELAVLRGAKETLTAQRPVLMVELLPAALALCGSSGDELLSFLQQLDYKIRFFDAATGRPGAPGATPPSDNFLALPAEKETRFTI